MRVKLFTSGSTGVPKGVATAYSNLNAVTSHHAENLAALIERQPVFLGLAALAPWPGRRDQLRARHRSWAPHITLSTMAAPARPVPAHRAQPARSLAHHVQQQRAVRVERAGH
ncbi:hypothetical protein ACU4GD_17720 [Cupriavidus basilensis]